MDKNTLRSSQWNALYKIGQHVSVLDDFGNIEETLTRSEAWELSDGTHVIKVVCKTGAYMLERVQPVVTRDPSAAAEREAIPPVTAKPNPHKCPGCECKQAQIDTLKKIMSRLYATITEMDNKTKEMYRIMVNMQDKIDELKG